MAIENTFIKDPNAILEYGFNWSGWLSAGESITTYVITISPSGTMTSPSDSKTSGSVIVWLSGGVVGTRYSVSCLIDTTGSHVDERTIKIDVKER